jgi:hypothetical protein
MQFLFSNEHGVSTLLIMKKQSELHGLFHS